MTATWDCQEARTALGVYVLGAIDPGERVLVDEHLDTCQECRAELAEFMELPGLLALVPAEEAIALAEPLPGDPPLLPPVTFLARSRDAVPFEDAVSFEDAVPFEAGPPDAMLAQFPVPPAAVPPSGAVPPEPLPVNVVDLAAARRRRRGLASVAAVAAAAVVIGAASFGGVKLAASPAPAPAPQGLAQDLHPAGPPNGAWQTVTGSNGQAGATVAYQSMRWGTQLEAKVSGLPVNTPCQMWVVDRDGTRELAGGWVTDTDEGTVWYPSSAGASATDIKSFVITVQGGQPITVTT
jgi:hypothetical protein